MAERNSKTPVTTRSRKRATSTKTPPPPTIEEELDVDDDELADGERDFDADEVYRRARVAAVASIRKLYPQPDDQKLFTEAIDQYARAVQRSHLVMQKWIEEGRPLTDLGSMRQTIEHPLVKMIREHEKSAADLAKRVGLEPNARAKGRPGRPVGAASAPDRAAPPAVTTPGKARMTRVK